MRINVINSYPEVKKYIERVKKVKYLIVVGKRK